MTAPAQGTNMTQPPPAAEKAPKMVKVRAIRPIRSAAGVHAEPGQTIEVTEDEAKAFCEKKFRGAYQFSGERRASKQELDSRFVRAERVK